MSLFDLFRFDMAWINDYLAIEDMDQASAS